MPNEVTRRHREAASKLSRFVAAAWVDDPTHTYGLATAEIELLTKAAQLLADTEAAAVAPWESLFEAGYVLDSTMPTQRDPRRSLHVNLVGANGGTWTDAARDLCAKLNLKVGDRG